MPNGPEFSGRVSLPKGSALRKVGSRSFQVEHALSAFERAITWTDDARGSRGRYARENAELLAVNEQPRAQLDQIGSALGSLTGGPRRGRGRRGADMAMLVEGKPKRTRKPITDPAQLERRRQALAKARAEKLAEAEGG